jgi:membrane-associated phospholipid phosphatase
VPFFVLLPVFDPWTTNPLYNNPGAWHSHIAYLYPQAGVSLLQFINSPSDKWATGSCLPSLHVAIPLMVFWVLRKSRLQLLALFFLLLSLAEGFAVVYLGRHWVADVIFAAPYSYLVVRLVEHLNADFVWPRGYRQMSV